MQSSAIVACRTGVMLICLVAIPLAALFGTRLPDLVKQVLSHRWDLASVSHQDSLPEAPLFGPSTSDPPWAHRSSVLDLTERLGRWQTSDTGGYGHSEVVSAGHDAPVEPVSGSAVSVSPPAAWLAEPAGKPGWEDSVSPTPPAETTAALLRSPAGRVSDSSGLVPIVPLGRRDTMTPAEALFASPEMVEQSEYIQRRLRELGATYYALQTWGAQGQHYRFQARMAVGASAGCVRHFEAVDVDPLEAMTEVLDQVETWRASQPQRSWAGGPETQGVAPG